MKKLIYILFAFGILFISCKKNRTCECKNANGIYDAGEIETTKYKAKKYCKDLSTTSTNCYLK